MDKKRIGQTADEARTLGCLFESCDREPIITNFTHGVWWSACERCRELNMSVIVAQIDHQKRVHPLSAPEYVSLFAQSDD